MPQDDLLDFIHSVSGDAHLAIEENLGEGFVRLKTAEAERRQAKHDIRCVEDIVIEILRNARDAHAQNIFLATYKEGATRYLVCIDDGDGIPSDMHNLIFEPRVTSKLESMVMDIWGVHGRGMALYSIRSNSNDAHVASSAPAMGASMFVSVNTNSLPEKSDQSSMPVIEASEANTLSVISGPNNINRMVIEFAIDMKDKVNVYLGTPSEIVATLVQIGRKQLTDTQLLFCDDISQHAVMLRPAAAGDATELVKISKQLGLHISERTAHRILAGQIEPVTPPLNQLIHKMRRTNSNNGSVDIYKDSRGLKISKEDLSEFARSLEESFTTISRRYYIELIDEPIIRVGKDAITVKFPFDKEL